MWPPLNSTSLAISCIYLCSVLDTPEFFWHAPDNFQTLYERYEGSESTASSIQPQLVSCLALVLYEIHVTLSLTKGSSGFQTISRAHHVSLDLQPHFVNWDASD